MQHDMLTISSGILLSYHFYSCIDLAVSSRILYCGSAFTMICTECGQPISHVYREFSKGNIRLTKCVRSQSFSSHQLV